MDENRRHTFYKFFHELSDDYEIISPDAFLRPCIDDVDNLAKMYRMVRENFDPGISVDHEFSRKVAHLVQTHTTGSDIGAPGKTYRSNHDVIRYIEEKNVSDIEKVFNLRKGIHNLVEKHAEDSPYLLSIGEKADAIIQVYMDRQKTTQEILEELKKNPRRDHRSTPGTGIAENSRRRIFYLLASPEKRDNRSREEGP